MLIGPTIGGLLMGRMGLTAVVFFNGASYIIAGVMIALIRRPPKLNTETCPFKATGVKSIATTWRALWCEWLAGLRAIKGNRAVTCVFVTTGAVALGEGILSVLLIPFLVLLGGGAREFGWLLTIRGVGGLIGGFLVSHVGRGLRPAHLFPLSLLIAGILGLILFNLPVLYVALVILFLWGTPAMGAQASSQTLLQTSIADTYQGRVFGAYGTTSALALLCGQGLASTLGSGIGTVPLLNVDAGLYLLASLLALLMLRGPLPGRKDNAS